MEWSRGVLLVLERHTGWLSEIVHLRGMRQGGQYRRGKVTKRKIAARISVDGSGTAVIPAVWPHAARTTSRSALLTTPSPVTSPWDSAPGATFCPQFARIRSKSADPTRPSPVQIAVHRPQQADQTYFVHEPRAGTAIRLQVSWVGPSSTPGELPSNQLASANNVYSSSPGSAIATS